MSKKLILPCSERTTLEEIFRNHPKPYLRNRSQCMLLLSEGFKVSELAEIYKTRKHTIYEWLRLYEKKGFIGLKIKKGRGLKSVMLQLDAPKIAVLKQEIENNPQNLNQVSSILSKKFGFTMSKTMLKRYLKKKLKYTWHRIRKWLKPKQNQAEYDRLAAELEVFLEQENQGLLRIYFADESGFSLDPCIPYGWQESGKYTAIVPEKSPRRNVFGLLSRDNHFEGYDTLGSINAELLITFLDDFVSKITEKSLIVMDNAPFHHAKILKNKMEEWAKKGLSTWFLPSYSPDLNKIETLWRKVKYEWLKPNDYLNWDVFNQALDNIFNHIGQEFTIKFS